MVSAHYMTLKISESLTISLYITRITCDQLLGSAHFHLERFPAKAHLIPKSFFLMKMRAVTVTTLHGNKKKEKEVKMWSWTVGKCWNIGHEDSGSVY